MCTIQDDDLSLLLLNILDDTTQNISFNLDDVAEPAWRAKPMKEWTSWEVLDFIRTETLPLLSLFIDLERFECISGYIFENLSKEYCQTLSQSAEIGEMIFDAKEKYIGKEITNNNTLVKVQEENAENQIICDLNNTKPKKLGRPKSANKKRKSQKKSERLWEFIQHLLSDQKTCPEIIKWENFEEGTFKFVKSDTVARLWGSRNKNKNMTYEKFTRAIRYYYKSGILLPVPGKRLVYKFGPRIKELNGALCHCLDK